jgi:hypothetical protein
MFSIAPRPQPFTSSSYTLVRHRMQEPFRRALADAGVPIDVINDDAALRAFVRDNFPNESVEAVAALALQELGLRLPDLRTYNLMRLREGLQARRKKQNGGEMTAARTRSRKSELQAKILADYKTSLRNNSTLSPTRWAGLHDMEYAAIDGSGRKMKASSLRSLLAKALADEKALSAPT